MQLQATLPLLSLLLAAPATATAPSPTYNTSPAPGLPGNQTTFAARCEALAQTLHVEAYPSLAVTFARYMPKGTVIDPFAEGTNATCVLPPTPAISVNLCRVALQFETSDAGSGVHMEAWLPEAWNERFMALGTGGLGGCIYYMDLAYASASGFAAVSSDSGHSGTSGGAFLRQPGVLEDFVWRALRGATEVGKQVAASFYGAPHRAAYFLGCSQGGRQGFRAAQEEPELFDGIVAGAPGLKLPGLFQHMTRWLREVGGDLASATVDAVRWGAIQEETLRQCDGLDGVGDGIIEDTRRCKPDLTALACGTEEAVSDVCLTRPQLDLVDRFFEPWTVNETLIYPGMAHSGDELIHASILSGPIGMEPVAYTLEWPRFVAFEDLNYTLDQWTPADALFMVEQNRFNFNTYEGDLSEFKSRGGKLIHFHGQMDQLLDSTVSDTYYEHVSETMGASPSQLDEFYRYFRVSGLRHCAGGPGAGNLGQGIGSPPPGAGPEDNVVAKIVEWVEGSKAPDTLRGTKFVNDDPTQGVEYTRQHCRYPLRNVYRGEGDSTDENSWKCVE